MAVAAQILGEELDEGAERFELPALALGTGGWHAGARWVQHWMQRRAWQLVEFGESGRWMRSARGWRDGLRFEQPEKRTLEWLDADVAVRELARRHATS